MKYTILPLPTHVFCPGRSPRALQRRHGEPLRGEFYGRVCARAVRLLPPLPAHTHSSKTRAALPVRVLGRRRRRRSPRHDATFYHKPSQHCSALTRARAFKAPRRAAPVRGAGRRRTGRAWRLLVVRKRVGTKRVSRTRSRAPSARA